MKKKVCIIDYKLGNLFSVNQALMNIGLDVAITTDVNEIDVSDALVLPGVGAFGDAMRNLRDLQLIEPIINGVNAGKPFLGICLGLQLLFTESEEFLLTKGLNLIKGRVTRFNNVNPEGLIRKVPQIGWNQIFKPEYNSWSGTPLQETAEGTYMYFVHSFYIEPKEPIALTYTNYDGHLYVSSVLKKNIFACQFHPEKSAKEGLRVYMNWAALNNLV